MAQFIEFIGNHWALSGGWILFVLALIGYQSASGGAKVSPHQATSLINRENGVLLDIRERKDFENGHIVNAVNIPLAKLKERLVELDKYKNVPIIVMCNMGHQAGEAVATLQGAEFTQVSRLQGGITEWRTQGLPVVG